MQQCSLMSVGNWSCIRNHNYHSSHGIMCFALSLSLVVGYQPEDSRWMPAVLCFLIGVHPCLHLCLYACMVLLMCSMIKTSSYLHRWVVWLQVAPSYMEASRFGLFLNFWITEHLTWKMTSILMKVTKQQEDAGGLQWAAVLRLLRLGSVIRQSSGLHTLSCSWW